MNTGKALIIHPHAYKHGFTEEQILSAWHSILKYAIRHCDDGGKDVIGIGLSNDGLEIQLIASIKSYTVTIFHALTPPQNKIRKFITHNTEVYYG